MKRLVKVFREQLSATTPPRLPSDKPINVVLNSGDTLYGKLAEQSDREIRIYDNRFHEHRIEIPDIDVVIYDHTSSY